MDFELSVPGRSPLSRTIAWPHACNASDDGSQGGRGIEDMAATTTVLTPATASAMPTTPARIDIGQNSRFTLIGLINRRLADTAHLHSQMQQARRYVKGRNFYALTPLFDRLSGKIFRHIHLLSERAAALGGAALRTNAPVATLTKFPVAAADAGNPLTLFIERYAVYAASIRKAIDIANERRDKATADVFAEISRTADEQLWFLVEAQVQQ